MKRVHPALLVILVSGSNNIPPRTLQAWTSLCPQALARATCTKSSKKLIHR